MTLVRQLFNLYCVYLVQYLDETGDFWPRVADNTISNLELSRAIKLHRKDDSLQGSAIFLAALEVLLLRAAGELPYPPRKVTEEA